MPTRTDLASECHELRAALKEWEKSFAEANAGRKPGKEDIKKNAEVAAKYRKYNRTRDVLDGKRDPKSLHADSPSVRNHKSTSSLRSREQETTVSPWDSQVFATPRRTRKSVGESHPSTLDPYDAPPASSSPHPYIFRNAIGPTPQRDGKLLGLFDLLSNQGSTPSTHKRKADALDGKADGVNVAQTPSRRPTKASGDLLDPSGQSSGGRHHSRTPASDGKKFMLSQFFATPSAMRFAGIPEEDGEDAATKGTVDRTPLRTKVLGGNAEIGANGKNPLENTPAFLRRTTSFNQRLLSASGTVSQPPASDHNLSFASPTTVRRGPPTRPFKGRGLSEIVRGLRQMEDHDNDDDDGMEVLREIEETEMNILVGHSQNEAELPALGGEPTRTWKKRGQKRTTRRVIMRPTTFQSKPKARPPNHRDEGNELEDEIAKVEETQAPPRPAGATIDDEDDMDELQPLSQGHNGKEEVENAIDVFVSGGEEKDHDDGLSDSDFDELASSPPPKKRKTIPTSDQNREATTQPFIKPSRGRPEKADQSNDTKAKEDTEQKKKKKKGINPNATSHMNFRSLKIRNRNSKGKGRFGRGRR
jgi:DNA replication and checkpoint protein